jgi:hypothetical protein
MEGKLVVAIAVAVAAAVCHQPSAPLVAGLCTSSTWHRILNQFRSRSAVMQNPEGGC